MLRSSMCYGSLSQLSTATSGSCSIQINPSQIAIDIGSMYVIYGNTDPINIPPMLAYIPAPWNYMDPMG